MKKLIILATLILISMNAFPQAVTELRPFWARQVPQTPTGANYFVNWGVGEGRTESEATNMAWADALQKSLHELGVVGITAQDINTVATNLYRTHHPVRQPGEDIHPDTSAAQRKRYR